MKNIFITFLILPLIFLAQSSKAQWVKVSGITENQVNETVSYNGNLLIGAGYVYKSTDLGQTFTSLYNLGYGINALSIVNGNVWVGNDYQNYYSTNDGVNWINVNLNKFVYDFISYNTNWIFAGTESNKCYFTNNGGANWGQCTNIWEDVICFETATGKLLAGTSQGLYYTTETSFNWTITSAPQVSVDDILKTDSTIFVATLVGIWKSTDNAVNWTQTSFTGSSLTLESFNQYIFAGTSNIGFIVTSNNGLNWNQRNEGLVSLRINDIVIIDNMIFAGTETEGLWKRPLSEVVGIKSMNSKIPNSFSLSQNYPNPFNPSTNIKYQIARSDFVTLKIFDILGKEVTTLVNEKQSPGTFEVNWNATEYPSGVYFYKLITVDPEASPGQVYTETKRMVLIK